mgnify:CR=1 FL=1
MKDMTSGNPLKLLVMFSIPLLCGNVFQQLYLMADTIIVGKTLGANALAAVGATGSLAFMMIGGIYGLTSGFAVITAQRFGAGDQKGVKHSIATIAELSLIMWVVITVFCIWFVDPMLKMMNTPKEIFNDSEKYIAALFWGCGAFILYNGVASILRALGDSKTPLIFLVVASVLNIILDFVFILTFKMGVAGAAWATVVSQLVAGVWCFIYARKHFRHIMTLSPQAWRLDPKFAWEHLRVAVPMGTQFLIIAIGSIILQSQLNTLGEVTIAAYTAACRADQLAIQPFLAFSIALSTYVAQNYGAERMDRIILGIKQCIKLSVTVSIIGGIMIIIFNRQITMMFFKDADPELLRESGWFLTFNAVFYSVLAMLFILRNSLQAMGRAFAVLASGIVELFCRSFTAFYLIANFGFFGACFANIGAWWGAAIMLAIIYFKTMREEQGTFNVSHTRIRDSRI